MIGEDKKIISTYRSNRCRQEGKPVKGKTNIDQLNINGNLVNMGKDILTSIDYKVFISR